MSVCESGIQSDNQALIIILAVIASQQFSPEDGRKEKRRVEEFLRSMIYVSVVREREVCTRGQYVVVVGPLPLSFPSLSSERTRGYIP